MSDNPLTPKFRAGDVVWHRPSGERWRLAAVTTDLGVMPSGWPPGLAKAADCDLLKAATDAEHQAEVLKWAPNRRGDWGFRDDPRCEPNRPVAVALGLAEYVTEDCPSCGGRGTHQVWYLKPEYRKQPTSGAEDEAVQA